MERIPGLMLKRGPWLKHQKDYSKHQKQNLQQEFRERFSDTVMNATVELIPVHQPSGKGTSNIDVAERPRGHHNLDFLPTQEQTRANTLATIHTYQQEFLRRKDNFVIPTIVFEEEDREHSEDVIPEIFCRRNLMLSRYKVWINEAVAFLGQNAYPGDNELESMKLQTIGDMQSHLKSLDDTIQTTWKLWCAVNNGEHSPIPEVIDCCEIFPKALIYS
ncbi:hypothetical protein BDQ17DRAFT_1339094 [Cyathus striatus]|nr:hypothetical protein BDQ17DRAFT_1339094 [Cyathus striatus]